MTELEKFYNEFKQKENLNKLKKMMQTDAIEGKPTIITLPKHLTSEQRNECQNFVLKHTSNFPGKIKFPKTNVNKVDTKKEQSAVVHITFPETNVNEVNTKNTQSAVGKNNVNERYTKKTQSVVTNNNQGHKVQ